MDYFSSLSNKHMSPILRKKRPREESYSTNPKIKIVRSESLITTRFYFPGQDETTKTEEVITHLDPSSEKETLQEVKSRLKLIDDTILYATNKIHDFNPEVDYVQRTNYEDELISYIPKETKYKLGLKSSWHILG